MSRELENQQIRRLYSWHVIKREKKRDSKALKEGHSKKWFYKKINWNLPLL